MFKKLTTLFLVSIMSFMAFASDKTISIGTVKYFPMLDIVKIAKADLEKKGYKVDLKEFSDYKTPNIALATKEIDANFIQHKPYMMVFSKSLKSDFVPVAEIYNVYVAFYSKKYKDIKDLPNGATIALSNDPVNHSWGLQVLAENGLFKLGKKQGDFYTEKDIVSNPKKFKIIKVAIPTLSQAYQEYDLVFNWPAHMVKLGIKPLKDGVLVIDDKKENELHAVTLVTRKELKDTQKIKDLKEAMTSKKVKDFLEKNYKEQGYPVFK
ncbi:MetQ/NlpA family ABC transporter substrate-binding protein [Oceanivirga salmonicida]|uniref:MetQ/NlpA family ABC transporter substrate-binding protein n=1 Tax=Oceanivirga salmonicida TaxID=1769291 RepID=UPI00083267A3|nr:MetQ/NlpA family ABC transporter substrate-binding protein [Oceanivirga salmonicida]